MLLPFLFSMIKRFQIFVFACAIALFSTAAAPLVAAPFADITDDDVRSAVHYLESLGIVEGYSDGTFGAGKGINRAEFLKIMYRTLYADQALPECDIDALEFRDIDRNAWYASTLCVAYEEGVIKGYPDATFKPSQLVNVAEAAAIIDRAMFEPPLEDEQRPGDPWYAASIRALSDVAALPTSIRSLDRALTRGEMAQIVFRLDSENTYLPSADSHVLLGEEGWEDEDEGAYAEEDEELVAMSAEDCFEGETFDPVEEVCYIEITCDDAADCQMQIDALQEQADAVLEEADGFQELNEEDSEALARYTVSGDQIALATTAAAPEPWMAAKRQHEEIWQYFTRMIPQSARTEVGAFEIVTDGKENTLAAVYEDDTLPEGKRWVLQVDIADAYADEGTTMERTELAYSLIHEYAHLLTLNASQFRTSSSCPSYETEEGCTKEQAYLNRFYQRFWSPIAAEYKNLNSDEDLDAFYQKYQDRFVTDYAASSPEEDIAESFTYFVLSRPKGDGIVAEKVKFFSQFDELRNLRSVIVQRLDGAQIAQR